MQGGERHGGKLAEHGVDAGGVVGGLTDGEWLAPYGLPAALQMRVCDHPRHAATQGVGGDGEGARGTQHVDGAEHRGYVLLLVFALELLRVVADALHMVAGVGEGDGGVALGGDALEDRLCLGLCLPYHHGDAGLDDAGLLDGYLLQRVAEELRVVEAYVGDDGEKRRDDVGAVQTAAHAHFDDGDVHLLAGEIVKGEADGHLEKGEMEVGEKPAVGLDKVHDGLLRNHVAVDADALAEVDKVRRGVEADLVARLLQDGGEEVADGAFAVGAGHMYASELALRVAEGGHEVDGGLYVCLIGSSADALVHRQLCKHEVKCLLIGHLCGMV